jgi:hypothetical protein
MMQQLQASFEGLLAVLEQATASMQDLASACQEDSDMDELLWDEIYRLRGELNAARADLAQARREVDELRENPWGSTPVMGTAPLVWSAPFIYTAGSNTLVPYDLQAPAQTLTPSYSPIRTIGWSDGNTFTITGATFDSVTLNRGICSEGDGTCCGPLSPILPVPVDEAPHAIEPRKWQYPVTWNLPEEAA